MKNSKFKEVPLTFRKLYFPAIIFILFLNPARFAFNVSFLTNIVIVNNVDSENISWIIKDMKNTKLRRVPLTFIN